MRVVFDTSVLVAAVRSRQGASFALLELAFAAGCTYIVTHNLKDFHGSEQLGITAITPGDFLELVRNKS